MAVETLQEPLLILHLEDDEPDHWLVGEMLATEGVRCQMVLAKSKAGFVAALARGPYDLIISDYSIPAYDGLSALAHARATSPDTPFMFFSGTIGEEVAVDSLKHGAVDYVLKHRPSRLAAAVRRAVQGAAERRRLVKVEEQIRQQAALLDKAHDAFVVCSLDWRIEFWNQGAARLYGWTAAEAVGENLQRLLYADAPPAPAVEMAQRLPERGEWAGDLEQVAKDGRKLTVRCRGTQVRDDNNRPKSFLIVNTDVTEHIQLEEQFLRAQRLESLGALVSGIAHDLNNTLVPIMIGVELLREERLSESVAAVVQTMGASARRSAEMIRQMLVFARGGEAGKQSINPDRLLKEMARVIVDTFPKHIRCRVDIGPGLHPIHCVPTQMHQVLMNLCVNARDAMPERGLLTLAAHNVSLDQAAAARLNGARAGKFLCLSVADTGTGISPGQRAKLFQPFFTTKPPGKGTGLGLSTCLGIVKKHDGFITVSSQPDVGTEFRVYLPAAEAAPADLGPVNPPAPLAGHGERILVVDDEAGILAMTRAVLENFGYAVSTAANGLEAVSRFRESADTIKLVITNHALPILGAKGTIHALREIRPDVKVVLMSGMEVAANQIAASGSDRFLSKPFTTETLLRLVHEVLNP